jgi:hypothetical protein
MVGSNPYGIFVNTINTVYVADRENNQIVIWLEGSIKIARTISGNLSYPYALFVTTAGDIYVDNGYENGRVNRWTINTTIGVPVMYVDKECYGLFVDISDTLYCSIGDRHQVVAKSLNNGSNTVVAGTGCPGSASDMLYFPRGIFVDTNLDLYVADCFNDRIQLFHLGQFIGLTVAGNGTLGAFTLSCPTGVVLDADKYLFIVDSINHRIIGSGPNEFRCIVGCSGSTGSASNQLNYPQSMAFDSYGNIYVTDQNNHRIQKFIKVNNNGGKCDRSS